jgi:phosphocarrier protein FPr
VIGLVLVSHSAALADGVLELAREMAGPDVRLAAAGGLALPGRPLGTDPARVAEAIRQVDSPDGVVVLMDMGSAVLSAEMALDLLPGDLRSRVALCGAPLVEGAVAAAVQARLGADLARVLAEAGGALATKAAHLQAGCQPPGEPPAAALTPPPGPAQVLELVVANRLGLHARPAARLVRTAAGFPGTLIQVRNLTAGRGPAPATSINAIAMLGLSRGQTMAVEARGAQAGPALEAIRALARERFGDGPDEEGPALGVPAAAAGGALLERRPDGTPGASLAGRCAAPGLAQGPARHLQAQGPDIPQHAVADPAAEWTRLAQALDQVRERIRATLAGTAERAGRDAAGLFDAHLLFLDDPALREPARRLVREERLNAAAAWQRASEAVARDYRALEDPYLRVRADDVLAVAGQVAARLLGQEAPAAPALAAPGVLVAQDLTPAETAGLDPALVLAICTAGGAPTSHSAILARALGIPAVVGLGEAVLAIPEGTPLLVDAELGRVTPDPGPADQAGFRRRQEALRLETAAVLGASGAPAVTRDGRRVEVGANIGSLAEARAAVAAGAEGVGLLRTEFLFTGRARAPGEDEQYEELCALGEALGGRAMVVRTLDAGGDKDLPFLGAGRDANPFLGWRAIRIGLDRPEFFKTQLRAIVRAAARFPMKVMFPMVAALGELRAAKALLGAAREEAARAGWPVPDRVETGIMVEVPAAALRAHQLAPEVDFLSIGTNDLTQYTLAAERGNPRVAALADPFHPAVLDLVHRVVQAGHAHGRWVGVCGELGADPLAIPLLVGLGVDELSMAPASIPRAKHQVRGLDGRALRPRALRALRLETPEQVRAAVAGWGA